VVAGGMLLTASRTFDITRSIRVLVGQGVTPFVYFAVWPVAALALWRRKWLLAGVAVFLVAVHIAVTLPAVWPRSTPAWASGAPSARVLVANVKADNPQVVDVAKQVAAADVDVLVLIEVTDWWIDQLDSSGAATRFPYRVLQPDSFSARGAAIFSRLPIEPGPVIDLGRGRRAPSGTITLDGGSEVTLFAVHLVSPYAKVREERWRENFDTLQRTIPTLEGAYVLAGDFNATRWHPFFGRLLDAGLTDAHEQVGKGLTRSWPTDKPKRIIPTVMRLDHALMSDGVTATAVQDVAIPGSDHLGFVVDLAVRPR
jgi:endonuclease/exonuclease/phosphatase (EEP) superfamily protein YafD